jgi:hypothetical protein
MCGTGAAEAQLPNSIASGEADSTQQVPYANLTGRHYLRPAPDAPAWYLLCQGARCTAADRHHKQCSADAWSANEQRERSRTQLMLVGLEKAG